MGIKDFLKETCNLLESISHLIALAALIFFTFYFINLLMIFNREENFIILFEPNLKMLVVETIVCIIGSIFFIIFLIKKHLIKPIQDES